MIKVEDDLNVEEAVIQANLRIFEKVVASLTKREKSNFVIMTPHQTFALVPKEGQNKHKIDQGFAKSLSPSYKSFQMQNGIGEGIKNLLKEVDIVLNNMIETPVVLESDPKERMPN